MKTPSLFIALGASVLLLCGFANGILEQLDLSEAEAQESIRDNFIRSALYFPDNKTIKSIAVSQRATTVKELGAYIRQYIESPQFNTAYQAARSMQGPAATRSTKANIAERLAAIEDELNEAEEKQTKADPAAKKLYALSVQQLKQEKEALKNPSHPLHADYVENLKEETGDNEAQRNMQTDDFNQRFPATVKELVKLRLKHFLDVTANINFNAKLVQQGKFNVFADPALEAKDGNWKKLFRAGPQTIAAARTFAQQWLTDIQNKK